MKKILLPALLIGLLTACTDDDEKSSQALNGKWQTTKFELYSGTELVLSEASEEDNNTCPDYTEFKSDGNCAYIDMDSNCEHETTDLGAYKFDGTNLKMKVDGQDKTYKVTSLTATEFALEETFTDEGVTYMDKVYFKKLN